MFVVSEQQLSLGAEEGPWMVCGLQVRIYATWTLILQPLHRSGLSAEHCARAVDVDCPEGEGC